ncbi:MAG: DUF1223 domain-containing protein [Rhodobacteraceae bacterium]|nr:DUF1223 domain-containing protein [Paracoccaceae bacterium]
MRAWRWAAPAALALWTGAAAAQADRLVVVELYTSQGCSACPPADELLTRLAARDDVLALALHVDYWDYIGWADSFASPAFTARQKAYARAAGSRTIYTPQIVVGGRDHLVGTREMELGELIEAHGDLPQEVALSVVRSGGSVVIRASAPAPLPRPVLVQLVRYLPERTVEILRGENEGRTITYSNIVTDWRELARWAGDAPLELSAEVPGGDEAAVILQEEGPGAVVAAAFAR